MIDNPRGPYSRIRWFCSDGSVLPPEPFACRERGGGRQHAEYSAERERLLEGGVDLFEIKPTGSTQVPMSLRGSSGASLHTKALAIDWEDEIVKGCLVTRDGKIVHPALSDKPQTAEAG